MSHDTVDYTRRVPYETMKNDRATIAGLPDEAPLTDFLSLTLESMQGQDIKVVAVAAPCSKYHVSYALYNPADDTWKRYFLANIITSNPRFALIKDHLLYSYDEMLSE